MGTFFKKIVSLSILVISSHFIAADFFHVEKKSIDIDLAPKFEEYNKHQYHNIFWNKSGP